METLYEQILHLIGGGSVGAIITYLFTLKSRVKRERAEAEILTVKSEHDRTDLQEDQFEFLQNKLDKYIRDYHELEETFRNKMHQLRDSIDNVAKENSLVISEKCNEIAALKSEITYLKGIRCYNFTCDKRIKVNPDKTE